jgi:hypothetical protein
MSRRERITAEINKHSLPEDRPMLLRALAACDTDRQWHALAVCMRVKTGPLSYQIERQWVPTQTLRRLLTEPKSQ